MKTKVVDVSIRVTCLAEEADAVRNSLNDWYCNNETALVQCDDGGINSTEPRDIEDWMRETLTPFDDEN
jgi:hypothetical protein